MSRRVRPGKRTEGDSVPWYKALVKKAEEAVTIQERGDIVDTTLISLSIAVYVYMSMQLWRVYAHLVRNGPAGPPFSDYSGKRAAGMYE
eukprot:jgi/Tetstr1/460828/TSEL_005989.t1